MLSSTRLNASREYTVRRQALETAPAEFCRHRHRESAACRIALVLLTEHQLAQLATVLVQQRHTTASFRQQRQFLGLRLIQNQLLRNLRFIEIDEQGFQVSKSSG